MKSICFYILSIFCIQLVEAQDVLFEKEIKLRRGFFDDKREAYPVTNDIDKSVSLFLIDKDSIQGLLFDKDLNLIDEIEGAKADSKYEDLLGSAITDGTHTLFFSTKSHKIFQSVSYNFTSKAITKNLIDLEIKKERYVGSLSFKNKFYFLTIPNRSSTLKVYIFNSDNKYVVKSFDFPDHHFTLDKQFFTLSDAARDQTNQGLVANSESKPLAVSIDNEIPNPLDLTSSVFKLYSFNDNIVLTLNNQPIRTTLISIDVNTLEASVKSYKQAASNCNGFTVSSNSYIYDDRLYQLKVCDAAMTLSIVDVRNGESIHEFNATAEEEILFKNGPIMLEKTVPSLLLPDKNERILTKTKQFLRKVESSNAGICAYKINTNLELTIGGHELIQRGAPMGGMGAGMISTPFMISTPSYNPIYFSYSAYKTMTKLVYFKSLLNPETFDHQLGLIQQNAFDKIQTLTEAIEDKITADTIFKKDGVLILGYYIKADHKYIMRQFRD